MKQYKVLVTEKPLSIDLVERLTSLGCIVPYDSKEVKINVYIYSPLDLSDANLKIIKAIAPFHDYGFVVNENEIIKQQTKIEESSTLAVGGIVFYKSVYREVPFEVLEVTDRVAKISSKLRGVKIEAEVDFKYLCIAEEYFYYDFPKPIELGKKLVIDMDYVVYNGNNYKHFISALFPFLVRLELKYPNRNIILFNPDISATVFCQLAGLSVAFGDISSYLYKTKHETYVFTNDFRMLKLCDKVICMQGESIVDFTLLEAMSTYHCNLGGIS